MTNPTLRGFLLAAGFGMRLRPLTLTFPKALLPVCGKPVARYALENFARAGCEAVGVNLHHLGEDIARTFGDQMDGLPLTYSREDPIQGTLGALYPLRRFLAEADLVLLANGDTLCSWPWKKLIRAHIRSRADVTMLLLRRPNEEALGGPVAVDTRGLVVQLRDSEATGEVARRHVFAGAHVISPRLLRRIKEAPGDIVADLYIPLLGEGGRIQSVVTNRRWHDLGTPQRYLEASLDWVRASKLHLRPRSFVSSTADVDSTSDVRRAVIEAGAHVEPGATVEGSLILPGAKVSSGSIIRHSIVGPAVDLPPATTIERRMVTRIRSGYQANTRDSVMGELVYSALR